MELDKIKQECTNTVNSLYKMLKYPRTIQMAVGRALTDEEMNDYSFRKLFIQLGDLAAAYEALLEDAEVNRCLREVKLTIDYLQNKENSDYVDE